MPDEKKTYPFSIYLLKDDPKSALKEGHSLISAKAEHLPEGASIYILDSDPRRPWWADYFGVEEDVSQEFKGALLFIPVEDKWLALSFGQVFHSLADGTYEYDFGLRITLNSLDPAAIRSADMLQPDSSLSKRTQTPISSELTYLDFDSDSNIIKSLTGKVKEKYQDIFKNATGSSSLHVNLKLLPSELTGLCTILLDLYKSDEYKISFPNIQNVSPVRDPAIIAKLDAKLLNAFMTRNEILFLSIPDVIDFKDTTSCMLRKGKICSAIYADITIERVYEAIDDLFSEEQIEVSWLKEAKLLLCSSEGFVKSSYALYRAILFDCEIDEDNEFFHLCDGLWYRVERKFLQRLGDFINKRIGKCDLCAYNHDTAKNGKPTYSEENYNLAVSIWNNKFLCMDRCNIAPIGESQIEPCDVYTVHEDESSRSGFRAKLYHIKISTRSSNLSHQFNQGINSVQLIKLEEDSRKRMLQEIKDRIGNNELTRYSAPVENADFEVVYGIISHKPEAAKASNLPLFSKISLFRCMRFLDVMTIPNSLIFIPDESSKKEGYSRYSQYIVVVQREKGKVIVRPAPEQDLDPAQPIKGCGKAIKESSDGSQFRLTIKVSSDGALYTQHNWPYETLS